MIVDNWKRSGVVSLTFICNKSALHTVGEEDDEADDGELDNYSMN